ncbi:winged helix DNA-binding protein [Novosphingobium jiangmenense]|uniref:Winged helix DNA-binding protein n=1 Tax=Novosphingobium jiangmenense TaxID=2791981 RepID=A0ABS0HMD4_9SPHN|nr:winged helix DNA-binding protein [Novosphingobium jiangmenense]MBF9153159.1 winged helix DNA-binding protein [Novosphingobium jiangmenense]
MTVRSMRNAAAARRERGIGRRAYVRLADPAAFWPQPDAATIARHTTAAREIYAARRRRHKYLPADLFGEPTWDILLDLYVAARESRRVPTTSACIGAHVPPTTALRWLRILEARGMVEREDDGKDGRRTFVRLTPSGLAAMDGALRALCERMVELADEFRPRKA